MPWMMAEAVLGQRLLWEEVLEESQAPVLELEMVLGAATCRLVYLQRMPMFVYS